MAHWRNRMPILEGCLARCYHHLLSYLYVTMFIFGLLICVLSGLLAWNRSFQASSYAHRIISMSQLAENNTLLVIVFVFGLVTALVNLVGLCGSCLLSKALLKFYMITLLVLLITHGLLLVGVARFKPSLEAGFNVFMNRTVENINTQNVTSTEFGVSCDFMDFLSTTLHCCGGSSPANIIDPLNVEKCCKGVNSAIISVPGCTQLAIERVEQNEQDYVIVPSIVMIVIELVILGWTSAVTRQIVTGNVYY